MKGNMIEFEGVNYPIRGIRLGEYEVDVNVSTESLEAALFDADGNYTSREAGLLDEIIFFYAPDDMVANAGDDVLEKYVLDNLDWGQLG